MTNLKDFFNKVSNNNRIFTREDIGEMTNGEFSEVENAINYQMNNLGIPARTDLANSSDVVYVHAYTKSDGTEVRAHYRSKLGGSTNYANLTQQPNNSDVVKAFLQPSISNYFVADKLPQELNFLDGIGGLPTGAASKISNSEMSFIEKQLYNQSGQFIHTNNIRPISTQNLQNATHDFKAAKSNPHAHILKSSTEITNPGLNKLMNQLGIPQTSSGIIYDAGSLESKQLWKTKPIQTYIKNNFKKLTSDTKNSIVDIEFLKGNNPDEYLGIQHCKLYNPHIAKDGYFDGIIVDYYDFAYRTAKTLPNYLNNTGYSLQQKKYLKNYFNIYHIHEKIER